ncbi:MAG: cytochrome c family protein [Hyphomicrobiales bacterium]|nr:cytochrome c family protein [Hyphomicrobiales bacterium]
MIRVNARRRSQAHALFMSYEPKARTTALCILGLTAFTSITTVHPALAMPADAQNPANAESVALGESAAQHYCAKCHATGRRGLSPNPASPPFPRIAARHPHGRLAGVFFVDGTVVSHPGMPQFEITIQEADGLVAYLRSLAPRAGQHLPAKQSEKTR